MSDLHSRARRDLHSRAQRDLHSRAWRDLHSHPLHAFIILCFQKKDGFQGRGLAGFPAVLGLKSYFLEVQQGLLH